MWYNNATSKWVQTGGVAPKPLLEFTFTVRADGSLLTYYDMSAVDGYVVRGCSAGCCYCPAACLSRA